MSLENENTPPATAADEEQSLPSSHVASPEPEDHEPVLETPEPDVKTNSDSDSDPNSGPVAEEPSETPEPSPASAQPVEEGTKLHVSADVQPPQPYTGGDAKIAPQLAPQDNADIDDNHAVICPACQYRFASDKTAV